MKKLWKYVILLIWIGILLTGCNRNPLYSDYGLNSSDYGFELPGEQVDISYEVPVMTANVLVDQLGYETKSDKNVIFLGDNMPETFTVRTVEDDQVVFTGAVRSRGSEAAISYYGDFSELQEAGNYYIQIDTYGRSYPFLIHDNLYYSMLQRGFQHINSIRSGVDNEGNSEGWELSEKGSSKEIKACQCLYQLLFSYEMFPGVYTDDMGLEESGNDIPDILDECRYEIEWLIRQSQTNPVTDVEACAYRAAVLAKFAGLIKQYDAKFALQCRKEAEGAWKVATGEKSENNALLCLAAAELYRETSSKTYGIVVEERLRELTGLAKELSELDFYSATVYMNTSRIVQVDICKSLIKKIMTDAERITAKSKAHPYLIYVDNEKNTNGSLLQAMIRISVVNHVITNHEYNRVVENHIHYLMGCNPQAICYVSYWDGQNMSAGDIWSDPVDSATMIFILSGLLSNGM